MPVVAIHLSIFGLPRLTAVAFNLEDAGQRRKFLKGATREVTVPGTRRKVKYDPLQRVGVGMSRLGTSEAVAIGAYVVASGIYTVLGIAPPVFGSPNVVKLLTEGLEGVFGATFAVEPDPNRAAVLIRRHIENKRLGLGLPAIHPEDIAMPDAELELA